MMAAVIMCLVVRVADGTTLVCSDQTKIRIAGLEAGRSVPMNARKTLEALTIGKQVSCLPAGNEGPLIVAKCTLPDRRDLACTLIATKAAVRSDVAWRRYGLADCGSPASARPPARDR